MASGVEHTWVPEGTRESTGQTEILYRCAGCGIGGYTTLHSRPVMLLGPYRNGDYSTCEAARQRLTERKLRRLGILDDDDRNEALIRDLAKP